VVFIVYSFIFALGKLWADGGLRDLLVDSDGYAGNTVERLTVFHLIIQPGNKCKCFMYISMETKQTVPETRHESLRSGQMFYTSV
jgi:hypothetical protein